MADMKKWVITLDTDQPVSEVSREVSKTGFTVEQVLDQIGCITGSGSDEMARKLRKIPGVADVSPDVDVQLPPPGESETW